MKSIILLFFSILTFNLSLAQVEQKLNVDLKKFHIDCKIDTSKWRIVEFAEYNEQNPGSLEFLSDTSINFHIGYILKKSNNIMDPPVIMIQSMKAPEGFSINVLKEQADTVITNNSYLIKMAKEQKNQNKEPNTFLEHFLNSNNYFDQELNAFIIQMKMPGVNNEFNIIHSATFIDNGQMLTIKMIYLEKSQAEYFKEFNMILKSVKIK